MTKKSKKEETDKAITPSFSICFYGEIELN